MCLNVTYVPPKPVAIEKCRKWIDTFTGDYFRTPFRHIGIPEDGLIESRYQTAFRRNPPVYAGSSLTFEVVHAFTLDYDCPNKRLYPAYAFDVLGYDDFHRELGCRVLYIPIADKTGNREKIEAILDHLLTLESPDLSPLFTYLPMLRNLYDITIA